MVKKVNWNEYFSNIKHINEIKKAIKDEEEDKKRYKDLLAVNVSM